MHIKQRLFRIGIESTLIMGGIQLVLNETEMILRFFIATFVVCALVLAVPLFLLAHSKKKIFEYDAASAMKEAREAKAKQKTAGSLLEESINDAEVWKESDPCVSWEKVSSIERYYRKLRRVLSFLKELLEKSDKGKFSLSKIGSSREEVVDLIAYLEENFTSSKNR